jgi:hypothetical protein
MLNLPLVTEVRFGRPAAVKGAPLLGGAKRNP